MTAFKINCLIETVISVRDKYPMNRDERGDLADVANLLYESIDILTEKKEDNK